MDENNQMASTAGYDKIEDAEVIDEKTVKFTFKEPGTYEYICNVPGHDASMNGELTIE